MAQCVKHPLHKRDDQSLKETEGILVRQYGADRDFRRVVRWLMLDIQGAMRQHEMATKP